MLDTWLMAAKTGHLGLTVFRSRDAGATWVEASSPPAFRPGDAHGRAVRTVFWLTPGHADKARRLVRRAPPQGLFRTEDGGDTWSPVDGWNDHPNWGTWAGVARRGRHAPDGSVLHL
ncbi:MAG: hypothetical protein R2705_22615 [Ilumatobacteraceae bacterium]